MNGDRWWHNAACKGKPYHLFDPPGQGRISPNHEGIQTCNACPVRAECLEDALATGDTYGIRGLTANQRLQLLRRRARGAA